MLNLNTNMRKILALFCLLSFLSPLHNAQAQIDATLFDYNTLLTDEVVVDYTAMNLSQIQQFLQLKTKN